ncbi:MAG: transposase zinc-binding domain-containing protein [Saprospiraceae bacterium]|nr:transposase zinc-binding domain-containing protein [Saprospiraceae bacterium]
MNTATSPKVATVQSILNKYHTHSKNPHVEHVLNQLKSCRTAQLNYHLYKCNNNDCMKLKYQYHSCRNRHCPACGSMQKEQWVDDRRSELLPISYYHSIHFTT